MKHCLPLPFQFQSALLFSPTELDPLCLTHCSATSVNESDIQLAVASPNNAVCIVVKDTLEMTVQLKHYDVQGAKVSAEQTLVSGLKYNMLMRLSG